MPFYLRAGKCLDTTVTEVVVTLKRPPQRVFRRQRRAELSALPARPRPASRSRSAPPPNARAPRCAAATSSSIVCNTGHDEIGAYERLIGAALEGDPALFAREDGVLEAWRIVDPLLRERARTALYEPGSPGPAAADALVADVGRLASGP